MPIIKTIEGKYRDRPEIRRRYRLVMEGDHWLDGEGWAGPQPKGDNRQAVMELIKREFVYKNLLGEVCRRHRNSLVGREPIWRFSPDRPMSAEEQPTDEEQTLAKVAESALTIWWDRQKALLALQEAVMTCLWAKEGLNGVGYLRLYIPESKLEGEPGSLERLVPAVNLEEAMDYIYVHALSPLKGGIIKDLDDQPLAGYYHYKGEDGKDYLEINALAKTLAADKMLKNDTLYAADDTVVQLRNLSEGTVVAEAGYQLGGRLLTVEISRDEVLVSDSIISQQKQYNMAYTMMGRNVVQGGFLERTVLNAQLPGSFVDENGNPSDSGTVFKPDPVHVGPGSLNFLTGYPVKNELGEIINYTTPNVVYKDPVPVTTFIDTMNAAKEGIYEEAQQLFVLISGDATSSGQSRIQAANDFISSLGETAIAVESAVRQLLETVLAWGAYFADEPRRFESMRADVQASISAVAPTPDEIRVNIEQFNAGLLSRETTMARNGVEDVDAEAKRIEQELVQEAEARMARIQAGLIPGTLLDSEEPGQESSREENAVEVEAERQPVA